MYCRRCGQVLTRDAVFCPRCGFRQDGRSPQGGTIPWLWIILALIFIPPLGVILLFTKAPIDSDIKWAIGGLFLPGLWGRFIWRQPWSSALKLLLSAALLAAVSAIGIFVYHIDGVTANVALFILNLLILFAVAQSVMKSRPAGASPRDMVEAKLDRCHDLIAEIESGLDLELLPAGATLRPRYAHALELRAEGARLLEHAQSGPDLFAAEARIDEALAELGYVRDVLGALPEQPPGTAAG